VKVKANPKEKRSKVVASTTPPPPPFWLYKEAT